MDVLVEINGKAPGTAVTIVESQSASTIWLCWERMLMERKLYVAGSREEEIELEKAVLKKASEIAFERNRRVFAHAQELRKESPKKAIIIPRGYAHLGMSTFFDPIDYDITFTSRHRGAPRFSSEAIIDSFKRQLSEQDWAWYASLSLHFSEYYDANRHRAHDEEAQRNLGLEARDYAFRMANHTERACANTK
jgi:hypothetical protein